MSKRPADTEIGVDESAEKKAKASPVHNSTKADAACDDIDAANESAGEKKAKVSMEEREKKPNECMMCKEVSSFRRDSEFCIKCTDIVKSAEEANKEK